jgi:hypothetical protein
MLFRSKVTKLDTHSWSDIFQRLILPIKVGVAINSGIKNAPVIIGISVRI